MANTPTPSGCRVLAVKKPATVVDEMRQITEWIKVPVFVVDHLQVLGRRYVEGLVTALRQENLDAELIFEFFTPPPADLLKLYEKAAHAVYLQISPEDPDEEVRERFGHPYDNTQLSHFARTAGKMNFKRIDFYFMIGLPGQTTDRKLGRFFH